MGVNFKIAIYTGFAVAIFFPVFPTIFKRKSVKKFISLYYVLIGHTVTHNYGLLIDNLVCPCKRGSLATLHNVQADSGSYYIQ